MGDRSRGEGEAQDGRVAPHPKWMQIGRYQYGDAFYLQSNARVLPPVISANIALGKPATQSSLSVWSKPADAQGGNNGSRTGGDRKSVV